MLIAYTFNLKHGESIEEAEFDDIETVNFIADIIKHLGYEVSLVDAGVSIHKLIRTLEKINPDLIFNTAEGVKGTFREAFYPALFDLMRIPFTGSDAYTNTITLDKSLTKLLLKGYGINTPKWEFVDSLSDILDIKLNYPLIVKPNYEGSSKGIDIESIITSEEELRKKVEKKLKNFKDGLIIEEYIEGIDIAVPYLNRNGKECDSILPPFKYNYESRFINGKKYNIYDYELKHEFNECVTTELLFKNKRNPIISKLENYSKTLCKLFKIKDFARFDFRLTKNDRLYFIEVNALPSLQYDSGMYKSAESIGINKYEFINEIIKSSCQRFKVNN